MLTDEEKRQIREKVRQASGEWHFDLMLFATEIERAVLAKAGEQEVFAWGSEDGRVITKSAKSVKATADIFNIPLYAHPLPAQAIPTEQQILSVAKMVMPAAYLAEENYKICSFAYSLLSASPNT